MSNQPFIRAAREELGINHATLIDPLAPSFVTQGGWTNWTRVAASTGDFLERSSHS